MTLRVTDPDPFKVVYTLDDWKTNSTKEARAVGYSGFYADIDTIAGQPGSIAFTLYWPGRDKWLGRNLEVTVE
jgi:glucoamylase